MALCKCFWQCFTNTKHHTLTFLLITFLIIISITNNSPWQKGKICSSNNKEEATVWEMWLTRRRRHRDTNYQYKNGTTFCSNRKWKYDNKDYKGKSLFYPICGDKIRKQCDGSVSMELTTNKTDICSSHVVCTANVDGKPKACGNKN